MNVFDRLEALANPAGTPRHWTAKPLPQPQLGFDVALFAGRPSGSVGERLAQTLARLGESPDVERTRAMAGGNLYLRLADRALAAAGAALERGEPSQLDDLCAGERVAVHFCDPNATKALHVGHLRNIALGHALATALRLAGAQVEVRSVVADHGRNMAEALAATWPERERLLRGQVPKGLKADHFVGAGYRDYVKAGHREEPRRPNPGAVDSPMARELEIEGDFADQLLGRLLAGDPEITELSRGVGDLVAGAQSQTLARLGVAVQTTLRESDLITHARTIAAVGLRAGLLERDPEGSILYAARQPGAPVLQLIRADGAPTQHLRSIAYWLNSEGELNGSTTVRFCGDEWQLHAACSRELRSRLLGRPPGEVNPTRYVFHSMVAMAGATVSSSAGDPLLIDELLDSLAERVQVDEAEDPELLAARLALGFFLPRSPTASVDFAPAKLLAGEGSLGWLLTRARRRAVAGARRCVDGTPGVDDPAYRFAVLQGEFLRPQLRRLVSDYDSSPLARHLQKLASWYLRQERDASVSAVLASILDQGMALLGLPAHLHAPIDA